MLPAVREGHELAAMFVFPSLQHEYRAKAEDYISHFVGHEGAGSLLSTLKARRRAGRWRWTQRAPLYSLSVLQGALLLGC